MMDLKISKFTHMLLDLEMTPLQIKKHMKASDRDFYDWLEFRTIGWADDYRPEPEIFKGNFIIDKSMIRWYPNHE